MPLSFLMAKIHEAHSYLYICANVTRLFVFNDVKPNHIFATRSVVR